MRGGEYEYAAIAATATATTNTNSEKAAAGSGKWTAKEHRKSPRNEFADDVETARN